MGNLTLMTLINSLKTKKSSTAWMRFQWWKWMMPTLTSTTTTFIQPSTLKVALRESERERSCVLMVLAVLFGMLAVIMARSERMYSLHFLSHFFLFSAKRHTFQNELEFLYALKLIVHNKCVTHLTVNHLIYIYDWFGWFFAITFAVCFFLFFIPHNRSFGSFYFHSNDFEIINSINQFV